jgi:ATP-dependent protease ClpP protease subunit
VLIPNPNFRPDLGRSIQFFGEVTDRLVNELAPKILQYRVAHAPITVFINSVGGDPAAMDYIYDLLVVKGPVEKRPRIITVAIGDAKSAAANLLAIGDYAIAYPNASIHFHGVRYSKLEEVTSEFASFIATQLESKNREMASRLAEAGTARLAFHFARLKGNFSKVRVALKDEKLSDIECLTFCLKELLSSNGIRIITKAVHRWKRIQSLSKEIMPKAAASKKIGVEFGGKVLQHIINHEVKERKRNSANQLDEDAVFQIMSDFLLLRDYDMGKHVDAVFTLGYRFKQEFFAQEQIVHLDKLLAGDTTEQDVVFEFMARAVKPFCYFASCIWQVLLESENPLSPMDAYALGVVDEVYDSEFPSLRVAMESEAPNQPNLPIATHVANIPPPPPPKNISK